MTVPKESQDSPKERIGNRTCFIDDKNKEKTKKKQNQKSLKTKLGKKQERNRKDWEKNSEIKIESLGASQEINRTELGKHRTGTGNTIYNTKNLIKR